MPLTEPTAITPHKLRRIGFRSGRLANGVILYRLWIAGRLFVSMAIIRRRWSMRIVEGESGHAVEVSSNVPDIEAVVAVVDALRKSRPASTKQAESDETPPL